jgi:outer membrane protein
MRGHRIPALIIVLAATPHVGWAQRPVLPTVPQSLSLQDAIDIALAYNPGYRQAANDRSPAAWGVRNAYASFLPNFTASYGLNYSGSGTQTFLTDEFVQPSATIGSNYSLTLSMIVSGRTLMQTGLAKARLRAAEAGVDGAAISLEATVQQQYLGVLQAEAQVELAELQLRRNEEFLRLAQARFEVGQNTMLDVRQAEVARGQAEVGLLQARQLVTVEKLRLFERMGVPAPEDPSVVALTDSFPILEPQWQLRTLLEEAEGRNPNLLALRAQQSAAAAGERAAKSSWLPTLSLSAGWAGFTQQFTNDQFLVDQARVGSGAQFQSCQDQNLIVGDVNSRLAPDQQILLNDCSAFVFTDADAAAIQAGNQVFPFDFQTQPFQARATISIPIFNQFSRSLEISQASMQTDDANEAVRQRELQVRTTVSEAYYGLLTAHQTIAIQESNQVAAREQLRLATERYRVGSGTFFELLDAQLAALRAEADYINAVYAYHQAIATLEAAVGHPLR